MLGVLLGAVAVAYHLFLPRTEFQARATLSATMVAATLRLLANRELRARFLARKRKSRPPRR